MKEIKEVTAEAENFRVENGIIRRDSIEPLPVGSIIAVQFQIMGYDKDCDGSLMARLNALDLNGDATGWVADCIGMYPETGVVLDDPEELKRLLKT